MTTPARPYFTLTVEAGPGTALVRIAGDLDYDTSDELTERAHALLAAEPTPRELHLDCAQLRMCDSMGLSTLLMLHRGTSARGITLHLDAVPPFLERMLDITGTRQLFVLEAAPRESERTSTDETAVAPRPGGRTKGDCGQ
ncbi:STAS domain-containing protein [Streptomyces sp. NPDC059398]|uniref:STAS domain-containing protein n=1 Tax=Streptomyces sp. NPDC059398 TaxID=3346820 RepID=UPI003695F13B